MDLIAHRGFAGVNPENTVAAVRAASERADVIEIDVRRCGSGELVVVHDETVDRVTDDTGAVADLAAADLEALDVLGSGQGIPTLATVADAVPPSVGLNVELKERGIAADAIDAVAPIPNEVLLSSFLPGVLSAARAVDPATARALLLHEEPATGLGLARDLDCVAVHPHLSIVDAIVEPAHEAGLTVNAWTVETPRQVAPLVGLDVDGIIADYPAVLDGV